MGNSKFNKSKIIIRTIIFVAILMIIALLFLKGCNKNLIDGVKIIDIKQSVDSFNNDTIILDTNLQKGKKYSYDITIHNYLDEDYYLYKVEIDNDSISYDELIKLLKSKKDTKFSFNIIPDESINEKIKIKFYYGKIREITIGQDTITSFGSRKIKLPEGKPKEGYKFLGYTDIKGSTIVKYKENKEYDLKDGTKLYPVYKKDKTKTTSDNNPNAGTEKNKHIVTFDYRNGREKTTKEVTYNGKYGELPVATKNGYAFIGWYLNDKEITSDSIVTISKDETLQAKYIIINYSINYDLQGGINSSNPGSYNIESNDITLAKPSKPGYAFTGWTGSNGSTPEKNITIKSGSTGAKNYKANYSINESVNYKVIHKKEKLDGSFDTDEEVYSAPYGSKVKPSVKSYEGYTSPSVKEITVNQDGTSKVEYEYMIKRYTFTLEDAENVISSHPSGRYPLGTEITITAKVVPGYAFDKWSDGSTDNPKTITLEKNVSIKPIYTENANTGYTVKHYKQNISLNGYDLAETDNLTGKADTKVTPNVKDYEGFTAPVPREVTIKSDGTTVVEYNYTRNEYTFTLNDAADVISSLPSGRYLYETSITLTAQERTGYNFVGWSDGNNDNPRTISLTRSIELSPVYTNRTDTTYTVIYKTMDLNGETYTEYSREVLTGETGSKVTPEVITITGFTKPAAQEITIKADGTASLEYKYTRNKYNFAYSNVDDIDLENSTTAGNYYYETEITVKAKAKDGYTFKDWSNGDSVNPTTFVLDGATTITAYYEANKYNIVFNSNAGTGSMSNQEMTYDVESNLTKNAFTRNGYTFTGWNTDPDGEGTSYADEASVNNLAKSGNIILYAQWEAISPTPYTVIHRYQNLDLETYDEETQDLIGAAGEEITPRIKSRTGCVDPELQTVTIEEDGSTEVVYSYDREMYYFEIDYNEYVSASYDNGTYPYGTEIEISAAEKEGYTFECWSNGETSNPLTITLDDDIEIAAVYFANTDTHYVVKHYKQEIYSDDYELADEEDMYGTTDTEVTPSVKNYKGFDAPDTQTITITADGSAEVEYYYDRKMYSFELEDRDNASSEYSDGEYRYETEIYVYAYSIDGYDFSKWSDGNTDSDRRITLEEDISIHPVYAPRDDTSYTVIHRYQDTDPEYYSEEYEYLTGTTDTVVTPEVQSKTGFIDPEPQTLTITADGYAEVIYYYERETYFFEMEDSEYVRSSYENGIYPYGKEINVWISDEDMEGYYFSGWSDGDTNSDRYITLEEDISIYPIISPRDDTSYTVRHYYQDIYDSSSYNEEETEYLYGTTNTQVTPGVMSKKGFTNPELQTITITADGSAEVSYYYDRKTYSFNLEDNEYVSASYDNGEYPYGTEIELSAGDMPRYSFKEWSDGNTDSYRYFTLEEDTDIRAIYYLSEPYEVTFDSNGGEGNMDYVTYERNSSYDLPLNEFTNSEYVFAGWNTEPDGTGIDYYDGETVINMPGEDDDYITLYALWAEEQYVAQVGDNYYTSLQDAINAVPTTKVETKVKLLKDTSETITIANTKNVILNLQNYTLSNDGNNSVIINNGILKISKGNITSDAEHEAIKNNSGATLVMSSGRLIMTGSKQGIYNDGGTLTISDAAYIESESDQSAAVHNKSNGTVNITSGKIVSTSFYALYNEDGTMNIGTKDETINRQTPVIQGYTYGIVAHSSYNFYDGIIKGITNPTGKTSDTGNTPTVSVDTNETKINEMENNSEKVHGTEGIESSTYKTLNVKRDTGTYTITLDANGGYTYYYDLEKTVIKTESIGELPTATRSGYTFIGWFTDLQTGVKIEPSYIPTSDIKLYAKYYKSIDNATLSPTEITIEIEGEETISVTNIEEEYTFRSTNSEVATVDENGKVTGISKGTTAIEITGSTSGKTKTIPVTVLTNVYYEVTFNPNGGTTLETLRPVREGSTVGDLPTASYDNYTFLGWYTDLDTKVTNNTVITSDVTYYAKYAINKTIKYHSNDGIFNNNADTNTINYSYGMGSITKYSSTPNIDKTTGEPDGTYDSRLSINDVVTIEGASSLRIEVWYSTESINRDWLAIYPAGVKPTSGNYYLATISNGRLGGGSSTTKPANSNTTYHKVFTVSGDTAQFYFVSDSRNGYYGYYAKITANVPMYVGNVAYKEPTKENKVFAGWNTEPDGTGEAFLDELEVKSKAASFEDNTDLYAQYISTYTTFKPGKVLNAKIKALSGQTNTTYETRNSAITAIIRSENKPADSIMVDNNIVSTIDSISPIYMWYDSSKKTIYYYSEADTIRLNPDSSYMFAYILNLTTIDTSAWDTSKVTSISHMFYYTNGLTTIDVSNWNTSKVTDMSYMLQNVTNLQTFDVSKWDTSNVTDMRYMFEDCKALSLDVSKWNTSKVTNMSYMFYNCGKLETIDVSKWDTSNVTNMRNMFDDCIKLANLDVSKWDTSNVTNMSSMFEDCKALTNLDVSKWNTSKVTDMTFMFKNCEVLTTLDVSKWDTSNVTSMSVMFSNCKALTNLDVSKWDTSNVETMSRMFGDCRALTTLDVSKWDTSSLRSMNDMFYNCESLTSLDVSKWDTRNVTDMHSMFSNCKALTTIDLSSFDTSDVTDMSYMFENCNTLKTIYVSDKFVTTKVSNSDNMFYDNTELVGGAGTTYNSSKINKAYARIDLGPSKPGYFTNKDSYYVVFDANGGTITDDYKKVQQETAVGELPTPVRKGYTFVGWYLGLSDIEVTSDYVSTKSITVIARYYKDITGATITPKNANLKIGDTETITVTNIEEEYTFASSDTNIVTVDNTGLITGISKGTATITITGTSSGKTTTVSVKVFEKYYTISFETNGGSSVEDLIVEQGEEIGELPESEKREYSLEGWYLEDSLNTKIDTSYVPTKDTKLYANWENNPFDIVFRQSGECTFNGSSKNITGSDCEDYTGGKYINTNIKLFSEENIDKDFEIGFTIVSRGKNTTNATMMYARSETSSPYPGIAYRINDSSKDELLAVADSSISSKISYEKNTVTKVVLKRIDGAIYISINDGEDTQVIETSDIIETFDEPVTFGASLNASGHPQRYFNGTLSNMYIKLGIYRDSNKHTIRLDANGGTVYPKKKSVSKGEQLGELPTPTKEGYGFVGWVEDLLTGVTIEETYIPSSDMKLYAKYYKKLDGVTISPTEMTIDVDEEKTISVTNADEECIFNSINSEVATVDENGKVKGISIGTTDIEITGVTSGNKITVPVTVLTNVYYNVTFNPTDGTVEETTRRVRDGFAVGELPTASYDDGTFLGWYTDLDSKITEETVITSDVTYYAKYAKNKTIKYYSNNGIFNNNEEINTINYSYVFGKTTKYSSTPNVDNKGVANGEYDNNLSINDVVTIEGATTLNIEVWFSTESSSCDWLAIYPTGATPTSGNYSFATISNGKLAGGRSTEKPDDSNTDYHKTFTVSGDTAQFYFKSDGSITYYGYYAIITGGIDGYKGNAEYKESTKENKTFIGWNTKPDGTGQSFANEEEIKDSMINFEDNTSLYAQYAD